MQKVKLKTNIFKKIISCVKKQPKNYLKTIIEEIKNKSHEELDDELFQNIIKKDEKAWKVLKQCSNLDADFSPISIYTDLLGFDINELADAKDSLVRLSLITIEEDDEGIEYGIRIHRTI